MFTSIRRRTQATQGAAVWKKPWRRRWDFCVSLNSMVKKSLPVGSPPKSVGRVLALNVDDPGLIPSTQAYQK